MFPITEVDAKKPIEILDHAAREKLVFTRGRGPAREYLSAAKAGGLWVSMIPSMMWWFIVGRDPHQTSYLSCGVLRDFDGKGTYTKLSKRPIDVGTDYEDITGQIEAELVEAERIAKPHEFETRGSGSANPPDFLETLREIWNRGRPEQPPTP